MRKYSTILFFLFPMLLFSQRQISFSQLSVEDGLSQNSVVSIAQDSIGYLWFATQDGLNKYDGREFTYYNKQFEDITKLTSSRLGKIYIDRKGDLWIITISGTLEKYNLEEDFFSTVENIKNVSTIFQDRQLNTFVGTYNGELYKLRSATRDTVVILNAEDKLGAVHTIIENENTLLVATSNSIIKIKENLKHTVPFKDTISGNFSSLAITKDETVWIGNFGKGLYYKEDTQDSLKKFKGFAEYKFPQNLNIETLLVDTNNRLWVATYGQGAFLIDFSKKNITHFMANKNNPFSLHYNDVLCLYQDYTGTIWLGTDGAGLSYYDEHLMKFNVLTNKQVPDQVSVEVVRAIAVDNNNTMWLGTSGKGLTAANTQANRFKTFTSENSQLLGDRIMSLQYYHNALWVGHQDLGLQRMDANGNFVWFESTANHTIWKIYNDKKDNLWLCTRDHGLLRFDETNGIVQSFTTENSALTSNNIRTIEEGEGKALWIGTEDNGVYKLNTDTGVIEKIDKLAEKIKSLYFDGETLWIGTNGNGLQAYNVKQNSVKTYTAEDYLSNNVVYGILPDSKGNLWLSSNKGITKFNINDPLHKYIENFLPYSGLQAFEFNTGAYFKDNNGKLYFGGLEGVNWFNPKEFTSNDISPKTVLTKFEIFGKEKPLLDNVKFGHDQNTMTFTFAGLHFSFPEQNLYKYKLLNHDTGWTFPAHTNVAHYTNLPPNDYTFMVTSSNYDGVWNKEPTTFSFTVLKPWYATNTMMIVYVLLGLLSVYLVYRYLKFRWEVKTQLQLEHAETERLIRLDEFKSKLYTNISHEFRTPLTLITGPVNQLLASSGLTKQNKKSINLIENSSKRMLQLVNQLLDLSKLDEGTIQLQVGNHELKPQLIQLIEAFKLPANEKGIQLITSIANFSETWYDRDVVEKIVTNLLSNAIKYSPENTKVNFFAKDINGYLHIIVENNNDTLSEKNLHKIFERFYQNDKTAEGVGIGLSLIKELTLFSSGVILAKRKDPNTIAFSIELPIEKEKYSENTLIEKLKQPAIGTNPLAEIFIDETSETPIILVVEDNKEIREYIASLFEDTNKVLKAADGLSGIQQAIKNIPDIIISDIMMPKKDGIELCNTLKSDSRTSHIPIILLTAKAEEAHKMEGLKNKANDYITKPFNAEILKQKVKNQIENQRELRKRYSKSIYLRPTEIAITDPDVVFLEDVQKIIDSKFTDPNYKTPQFAKEMNLSRMQLHRKLKALTGLSTTEFIRSQRLKAAISLLENSNLTVSEIAYSVGFNTPSYFIKSFKDTYNTTPATYVKDK